MLQRVFVADLDPERLARADARAAPEAGSRERREAAERVSGSRGRAGRAAGG